MTQLKMFIESLIYVAMVAIIIEIILPKGNIKKYVYILLSLFVFLNVLSPVINVLGNIDMQNAINKVSEVFSSDVDNTSNNLIENFTEYKTTKINEELEEKLKIDIKEKLEEMNIKCVDVKIRINEDYTFQKLEINIENLEKFACNKVDKISSIISKFAEEYQIPEDCITIIEEGE